MKRKKSILNRLLYFANSIFALLLLAAYLISKFQPDSLGSFAGLSLLTPVLIFINFLFLVYWLLTLKRAFLWPLSVLLIGYSNLPRFYKLLSKKQLLVNDIKIMSYNVRMFNKFQWIKEDSIGKKINELIYQKSPDILCFQEYTDTPNISADYKYKHIVFSKKNKLGQAIFSKFPIVDKGSLNFENTANNILYADVRIDEDTVRIYNIHLQSLKLNPKQERFGQKDAMRLRQRISTCFRIQQHQVERFIEHQKDVAYPIIIAGDFNNTAFSWAYRTILKKRKDAFVQAGKGFGKTYDYFFPIRIDFIMIDKKVKVNYFKAYSNKYSDHFPILARIDRGSLLSAEN